MSSQRAWMERFFIVPKSFVISFLILAAVFIARLTVEPVYTRHIERNWLSIATSHESQIAAELQDRFSNYVNEVLSRVREVAHHPTLITALGELAPNSRETVFKVLLSRFSGSTSVAVFDARLDPLAWVGEYEVQADRLIAGDKEAFLISQGPLFSYLHVEVPVVIEGKNVGYIAGKKLFDVSYPISNRFVNREVFADAFSSTVGGIRVAGFSPFKPDDHADQVVSVPLVAPDAQIIGYAQVNRQSLAAELDEVRRYFGRLDDLLILGFTFVVVAFFAYFNRAGRRPGIHVLVWTIIIWGVRYVLVWRDLPASLLDLSIFDPLHFASGFGFGLAKSVGDLFLSALALLFNVILLFNWILRGERSDRSVARRRGWPVTLRNSILIIFLALVLTLLLRGFAATVRSAVFDSNLPYNDPTSVIPSPELAVMLTGLGLISVSLVLVAAGIALFSRRLLAQAGVQWRYRVTPWFFVGLIFVTIGVLVGVGSSNPLMSQFYRLSFIVGTLALAIWVRQHDTIRREGIIRSLNVVIVIVAIVLLVSLLDREVHEYDRHRVELLAREMSKPADHWLTFLVNQALDEMSGDDIKSALQSDEVINVEKLAFTQWAKSILSREGNNCTVAIIDRHGDIVSDFHIGIPTHDYQDYRLEIVPSTRLVAVEEKTSQSGMIKWYVGYNPITDSVGSQLGAVKVEVSGSREAMLHKGVPEILRTSSRESFVSYYRPMILSEYVDSKLVYTTDDEFPRNRVLPIAIAEQGDGMPGTWIDESLEGRSFETYFRGETGRRAANSYIALSLVKPDVRWHLYAYLRYVLFFGILGALGIIGVLVVVRVRRQRVFTSLRSRLLVAFAVVSLIPVVILAYYNREYAFERARELSIARLNDKSSAVVMELRRHIGSSVPVSLSYVGDALCADIADDLNTDFNLYMGSQLLASSRPEIFDAGLLDPTLSASAYLHVVLYRKRFFVEDQTIGNFPYVVGYRPLIADDGSVMGVIAVPTLYQQSEINEELARRNVFLFGAYALALSLSLLVGSVLANRISSPVRRLQEATLQIGGGRLDVHLKRGSYDELGDLEQAFEEMTRDLKRSQDEMLRTQRERAWREMAKQVAHEIKNPLTPMRLSIQHLRQAYRDNTKGFTKLLESVSNTLLEQIETLNRIASEFSHFARMPQGVTESFGIHEVLREAAALYEGDPNISIQLKLISGNPEIKADREEIRRAFINIIRNAVQALEHRSDGRIDLSTEVENNTVIVRFADNGIGIPFEVQKRLFEPNFSTKTDGMGLGLAIVKRIVDDLNGSIEIKSEAGKGTEVILRLPIVSESSAVIEARDPSGDGDEKLDDRNN